MASFQKNDGRTNTNRFNTGSGERWPNKRLNLEDTVAPFCLSQALLSHAEGAAGPDRVHQLICGPQGSARSQPVRSDKACIEGSGGRSDGRSESHLRKGQWVGA